MKLLKTKTVLVGAINVASDRIETPEEVAETLKLATKFVDPERIQACTNCGMAPMTLGVAYGKLRALAEGALRSGQRRRGGKKSLHSDEVQFRAVRDWMTMQSHGTSVTLQQFLEERFGVAPETGMALVPNQTFYGWRKKFLEELEKHKQDQSK
jgi:hypothetical protein